MTTLQPVKGTDAGLSGDEQVRIALTAIAEHGGVAQMTKAAWQMIIEGKFTHRP